jgi:hypothetical protein
MRWIMTILTLILVFTPALNLLATEGEGQRIWLEEPSFEKPQAGKWWLSHAQLIETDAQDGKRCIAFDQDKARIVSNFPFGINADLPMVKLELWAKNRGDKDAQLLVKLDVRQRKTNKYLRTESMSSIDIPVGSDWQKMTVTFKLPTYDPATESFKLELDRSWGDFLVDSLKAWSNKQVEKTAEQAQ